MKPSSSSPVVHKWLAEPMPKDVAGSIDRILRLDDISHVAVLPDIHLASDVCVGLVIGTTQLLYPQAVGGDIGCGMAAMAFDTSADLLEDGGAANLLLSALHSAIPALKHPKSSAPVTLPRELSDWPLSDERLEKLKLREGRYELGTLGRGNHFLEFQADSEDRLWLMLHSGSRAMGQAITAHHLRRVQSNSTSKSLVGIDANTDAGKAYTNDSQWAVRYAAENRLAMLEAITRILQQQFGITADSQSLIHCDHNHVRRESHLGRELWVHRKGALPAHDCMPGVIPGSMGTASYHVRGRGNAGSLCSSSHGAGRKLSRAEAHKSISQQQFLRDMRGVWFERRLVTRMRDEAPSAYKDIRRVMRAQRELTSIERQLRPLLSFKAG